MMLRWQRVQSDFTAPLRVSEAIKESRGKDSWPTLVPDLERGNVWR